MMNGGMGVSVVFMSLAVASAPLTLKLWPEGAPEPPGARIGAESDFRKEQDDGFRRITNVTEPALTVYRPARPNGTAVLVCPGGGHRYLTIEHEGTMVCEWLNSLGVTAGLLKYRVPARDESDRSREALQDAQRAMRIIRHHAAEWGVRPDRIGMLGFSAGAHVTIMNSLYPKAARYPEKEGWDKKDAAPNFAVAIYPGRLLEKDDTGKLGPAVAVTKDAPPLCLIHAHDDPLSSAGSALLYLEYKKLGLPCELHIYGQGGHAFGMKKLGNPVNSWPDRVADWMKAMGWLP